MSVKIEKLVFVFLIVLSALFAAFLAYGRSEAQHPVFIFAYGGNLEKATFSSRSGGFENAAPAKLEGFALAFQSNKNSEFGVANIVALDGGEVAGAVYTVSYEQARALDSEMGVPGFYRRMGVKATLPDGKTIDVQTYALAGDAHAAPPSRPTMEAAAKGLSQFGWGADEENALAGAAKSAAAGNN